MISGHRRMHAAERAGLTSVPAIIREMDDDTATVVMVEANAQREEVLPSEKAFSYKMKYEAVKRRVGIPEGKLSQVGTINRTDNEVAQMVGESRNQLYRFMRLTDLIKPLLDLVDAKKMPLATAVEVSYLDQQVQENLAEFIRENGMVKSYQIAAVRKYLDEYKSIGKTKLAEVLMDGFNAKTMPKSITIPEPKLKKFFSSNYTIKDMEKIIYRFLDDERLAFTSAVYVSFLSEEEQMLVYEVIEAMGTKLKPKMAKKLRNQGGKLTEEVVEQVIRSMIVKKTTNDGIQVRLSEEIREKYFEGMTAVQIADIVEKAVVAWFSGKDGADV